MSLDHRSLSAPYWSAALGPCVCDACRDLRAQSRAHREASTRQEHQETFTDNDLRNRELIGQLRGTVGRQASRVRQLEALLRDLRDQTAPGSSASQMIERGLAEWPEEA
jgi:hypothetical protein